MVVGCQLTVNSGWGCFVIPLRCIPRNDGIKGGGHEPCQGWGDEECSEGA